MPLPDLTDVQLAYAAGIIDGEGCIRTTTTNRGQIAVRIHVTNTNPLLIVRLKEWFGGYSWSNKNPKPRCKPSYVWEIASKKAEFVLVAIRPFLLLKIEQADVALALRGLIGKSNTKTERLTLVTRLHVLNKKGSSDVA